MYRTADYRETGATLWTSLPVSLRREGGSRWADANRPGVPTDSFLEGPCFGANGDLMLVDIPHGRILRVTPGGQWHVVAEYDGWPNGLKVLPNGDCLVTDYRRGLVVIAPNAGTATDRLTSRNSESFKGLNDLHVAPTGEIYFTDQGQTGLQDPSGRVYRLTTDDRLELILGNVPSPNGVALAPDGKALFVAVTRDSSVWRGALTSDGALSKVGRFVSFFGATGPDGIAFDARGQLWVAHPSGDCVWVVSGSGEIARRIRLPASSFPTNLAFSPDGLNACITASGEGSIYRASTGLD